MKIPSEVRGFLRYAMEKDQTMLHVRLQRGADKRAKNGHPWIFSNEIGEISGERIPGETAEVFNAGGDYIGTGYYNPQSLIAVRLLSRNREDIDSEPFYRQRILKALDYRHARYPGWETFRAVYGEGDFLPGLVVDKYAGYLSVQFLTRGIERRRDLVIGALVDIFAPKGIAGRNDVAVRSLEGLEEKVEVLYGEIPETVEVDEHGLRFLVNILEGQKTGHFLDQKENHQILEKICGGKNVLDCFCYTGSWAIHAAAYGANSVTGVDSSEKAISIGRENASRNGLSGKIRFEASDAFERLRSLKSEEKPFDVVVLDPPAFIKSRKHVKEGIKGYLTINRRAMDIMADGGYLVTCSCSHHMSIEMFREMLHKAAVQAGLEMRLLETRSQAPDHPVLLSVPETEYLKCFVLQAASR
jgi:23S rRNA (cytosine1962-C5)-methyltransferase